MRIKAIALGFVAGALASALPAHASSSAWHKVEGGGVRLVTAGTADADGHIRGALEIVLEPGWKTYWRDPGDAGVPPSIDVSQSTNVASATLDYPPPMRFDDGYAVWAGYKESVSLPIVFAVQNPGEPAVVEADIFLGICETICVPVQARLSVDLASEADDAAHADQVERAFAALPSPEQPDFGVTLVEGSEQELVVEANIPGSRDGSDFFVASAGGYYFGPTVRREDGDRLLFVTPILDRPGEKPADGSIDYVLVTRAGSVSGTLPFP
jgi:DsbC/DsbD-like thiol-disulfide interchange protein